MENVKIKFLINHEFICAGEILPDKVNDAIYGYNPKSQYTKKQFPLNPYGDWTFCRFSMPNLPSAPGVYAVFINNEEKPVYIGRAADLKVRWGHSNYGAIYPRNCYKGGQSTNCKINGHIYNSTSTGDQVWLYLLITGEYKKIEKELIREYQPRWNTQLK